MNWEVEFSFMRIQNFRIIGDRQRLLQQPPLNQSSFVKNALILVLVTLFGLGLSGCSFTTSAKSEEVSSISKIVFGPDNVLFLADWKAGKIHAVKLAEPSDKSSKPFNLLNFDGILEKTLNSSEIKIEDVKARPGTNQVYVAVSVGNGGKPALLSVTADGTATKVDLEKAESSSVEIKKAPDSGYEFWDKIPERSFTVTDMQWHDGKLYIAGLSNQEFASTLRIVPFPFNPQQQSVTSVEIFHSSHNQIETRAPIRQMTFANLGGKDYLIGAYLCTPLVTIPLDSLQDGAHIKGKTIAELGFGNTPAGMLTFDAEWQGKKSTYLLVTNIERNAQLISLSDVVQANDKPGLSKQVGFGEVAGVPQIQTPFSGVYRIDNLNDQFLIALRRDLATGNSQLITFDKSFRFRISDFVSEYNFPGYKYEGEVQLKYIKPVEDALKKQEGYLVPESVMPNGPFPYKKGSKKPKE